jgi:hypothetical protein
MQPLKSSVIHSLRGWFSILAALLKEEPLIGKTPWKRGGKSAE